MPRDGKMQGTGEVPGSSIKERRAPRSKRNGPGMVDIQPSVRELSVVCRLPVFLELHMALYAAGAARPVETDLFSAVG
jgi:hypothetical protein